MHKEDLQRLDKTKVTIRGLKGNSLDDTKFWLSKTPEERVIGSEVLRMRQAGYDNTRPRLQRIITVRHL